MAKTLPSPAIMRCGTTQPDLPGEVLGAGPLSVEFDNGALRYLRVHGVEVLRSLAFLVRDENWGTYVPKLSKLKIQRTDESFCITYDALCQREGQELRFSARIEGRPDGSNNIQVSSFRYFCQQIALGRFAAAGNAKPSQVELDNAVAKLMGFPQDLYTRLVYSGPSQPQTVGTTDVSSKGFEFEATYNPTRNWRMKFTGSKSQAQDDRVSPEIYNWWQQRLPVWNSVRADIVPGDGKGRLWWDTIPAE